MSKQKRVRELGQLCSGEMQDTAIPAHIGGVVQGWTVPGWKCPLCGKELRHGVHSLRHVALKEQKP